MYQTCFYIGNSNSFVGDIPKYPANGRPLHFSNCADNSTVTKKNKRIQEKTREKKENKKTKKTNLII